MSRLSTVVWLLIIVVAAFMLYMVKYQVQSLKTQIAQTSRDLEMEKESLHVVAAEWAYLNRPERLRQLASKYLAAQDVTVEQVADIQAIPFNSDRMQAMADTEPKPIAMRMRKVAGGGR